MGFVSSGVVDVEVVVKGNGNSYMEGYLNMTHQREEVYGRGIKRVEGFDRDAFVRLTGDKYDPLKCNVPIVMNTNTGTDNTTQTNTNTTTTNSNTTNNTTSTTANTTKNTSNTTTIPQNTSNTTTIPQNNTTNNNSSNFNNYTYDTTTGF